MRVFAIEILLARRDLLESADIDLLESLRDSLAERRGRVSGVTMREAVKYL
jgi:hypothetical protein